MSGLLAAYALLLNTLLAGFLGARDVAFAASDAGFEICASRSDAAPGAPHQSPFHHATDHCLLCPAGALLATMPQPASVLGSLTSRADSVLVFSGDGILLPSRFAPNKYPRGPPQRA